MSRGGVRRKTGKKEEREATICNEIKKKLEFVQSDAAFPEVSLESVCLVKLQTNDY